MIYYGEITTLCLASGHLLVLEKQASDHYDYSDLNFCFWLRIIGSLSLSLCFFFPYNRKGETSADDKGRQLPSYQLTKRREAQEEESPPAEARNHDQNPSELESNHHTGCLRGEHA
ncbi:hypothetical protein NC652_025809 [Populus alba x Populus x berolinensis]|nr:hypothetical protein NC652_025809 [Populus alba x Populus x berolinensis]